MENLHKDINICILLHDYLCLWYVVLITPGVGYSNRDFLKNAPIGQKLLLFSGPNMFSKCCNMTAQFGYSTRILNKKSFFFFFFLCSVHIETQPWEEIIVKGGATLQLSYWIKIYHIFAQNRFEGILDLCAADFQKSSIKYFFYLSTLKSTLLEKITWMYFWEICCIQIKI